jgi:hypothetical protein
MSSSVHGGGPVSHRAQPSSANFEDTSGRGDADAGGKSYRPVRPARRFSRMSFSRASHDVPRARAEHWSVRAFLGAFTVLVLSVGAVFWRTVTYPLIQGDWGILEALQNDGSWEFVKSALSPAGQLFFRPVGRLYLAALYHVFGLNPAGYHVTALCLHVVNAALVARVGSLLTGRPVAAWAAAMLYGVAVNVHLEPLLWAVGVYELSATFFVLLSLNFFLGNRLTVSALTFFFALFSKEAAIFLILLLPVLEIQNGGLTALSGRAVVRLWRHLLVVGIYGVVRLAGVSPLTLEPWHPYYISRRPGVLLDNAVVYGRWSLEALAPIKDSGLPELCQRMALAGGKWTLVGVAIAGVGAALYFVRANGLWGTPACRFALSAIAWAGLGLIPVLVMPNHRYQYYLTYSLIPLALLTVVAVESLVTRMGGNRAVVVALLVGWVLLATWSSERFFAAKDHARMDAWVEGTNGLISRAYTVNMVSDGLKRSHSRLPAGTLLVFQGIDVWAFRKDSGPRVWYGDASIRVFDARFVHCEAGRLVVRGAPERGFAVYSGADADRQEVLDPERTLWFRRVDDNLVSVRLAEVCG